MRVIVRLAGPDGAFVELDALLGRAAEDHCAQPAVADRQSFFPLDGGLAVPEGSRTLGEGRRRRRKKCQRQSGKFGRW